MVGRALNKDNEQNYYIYLSQIQILGKNLTEFLKNIKVNND
jgi:hypothetical protein